MYPSLPGDGQAPGAARRAASWPGRVAALGLALALGTAGAGELLPLTAEQRQSLAIQTGELGTHAGAVASGLPARVVVPPTRVAVLAAPVAGVVHRVDKTHNEQVQPGEAVLAQSSSRHAIGYAAVCGRCHRIRRPSADVHASRMGP
jgi:cytochrome c553